MKVRGDKKRAREKSIALAGIVIGLDPLFHPGRSKFFRSKCASLGGECHVLPFPCFEDDTFELPENLDQFTHVVLTTAENETSHELRIKRRRMLFEALVQSGKIPNFVVTDKWLQQCLSLEERVSEKDFVYDYRGRILSDASEEKEQKVEESAERTPIRDLKEQDTFPLETTPDAAIEVHQATVGRDQDEDKLESVALCWEDQATGDSKVERAVRRHYPFHHPNEAITKPLSELAEFYQATARTPYELKQRFLATKKVIAALAGCGRPIRTKEDAKKIDFVGDRSAQKIADIAATRSTEKLENFRREARAPVLCEFAKIIGVGRRTAQFWYDHLDLHSIDDIREAIAADPPRLEVTALQYFGLQHFEELSKPIDRADVAKIVAVVKSYIAAAPAYQDGKVIVECVGGYRRGKPCSHDVDVLFTSKSGDQVQILSQIVSAMQEDGVLHTLKVGGSGGGLISQSPSKKEKKKKSSKPDDLDSLDDSLESFSDSSSERFLGFFRSPRIANGRWCRLDLVTCRFDRWAYALLGWTGSQQFERLLRHYSQRCLGYHLSSSGITTLASSPHSFQPGLKVPEQTHVGVDAPTTEKDVFKLLNLEYIEPEYRNA